jgi:hypothetical protein
MTRSFDPFRLLLIAVAGWINQQQQDVIEYLKEENRVLREQLGGKRLRLSDDQRRCLAARVRQSGGSCCKKWPLSLHPRRCWLGSAS